MTESTGNRGKRFNGNSERVRERKQYDHDRYLAQKDKLRAQHAAWSHTENGKKHEHRWQRAHPDKAEECRQRWRDRNQFMVAPSTIARMVLGC